MYKVNGHSPGLAASLLPRDHLRYPGEPHHHEKLDVQPHPARGRRHIHFTVMEEIQEKQKQEANAHTNKTACPSPPHSSYVTTLFIDRCTIFIIIVFAAPHLSTIIITLLLVYSYCYYYCYYLTHHNCSYSFSSYYWYYLTQHDYYSNFC